jgi:hypothetical protein
MGNAIPASMTKAAVQLWDHNELSNYLMLHGFESYARVVIEHKIDGLMALGLNGKNLVEIGYSSSLERRRILAAIERLHLQAQHLISDHISGSAKGSVHSTLDIQRGSGTSFNIALSSLPSSPGKFNDNEAMSPITLRSDQRLYID